MINSNDYSFGNTFVFGNAEYTGCKISGNGFIFFGNINNIFTYNPFADLSWKTIAPFAGDIQLTSDGIKIQNNIDNIVITWHCFSGFNIKTNIIIFSLVLYLNNHQTKPNQFDFDYASSDSQNTGFLNNYYIGYCDGNVQKYLGNVNDTTSFSYGGLNITSSNIFPSSGTTIGNVSNILPTSFLKNAQNGLAWNIPLNGSFVYDKTTYTTCNVSSNGYIFFGSGPSSNTTNLFSNSTWKIIIPFGGPLVTTNDGMQLTYQPDNLTITFNCYSKYNSLDNILQFAIKLYLNNHQTNPNQIDFIYTSATSRSTNFFGNYYIGYCDGTLIRSISNSNLMLLLNGPSTLQSSNIFPQTNTQLNDVLNISVNTDIYLVNCYDTIKKGVYIGGIFNFGNKNFNVFNVSSNGFIYFDLDDQTTVPPREWTTNPFYDKKWMIIAPFSSKLRTTQNGITVSRTNTECIITWNCYSYVSYTLSTIQFSLTLHIGTNLFNFSYGYSDFNQVIMDSYIGYSDGTIQKSLNDSSKRLFPVEGTIYEF